MASGFRLAFFLCLTGVLLISETWSYRRGCGRGWTAYGSRCFGVATARRTMADAERTCIALGGNLASIHSSRENNFIRILILRARRARRPYPPPWIGLNDAIQERKWMWTDGSRVRFIRWGRRQSYYRRYKACTVMRGRYWRYVNCHSRRPFVCAKKRSHYRRP